MPSLPRLVLALLVIAAAVAAILSPVAVGEALGRPAATTPSEMINLRASWGGALLGVGAAIGWARTETRARLVVSLVLWMMVGIGLARVVGLLLDGNPDRLQWLWLGAEVVIAAGCAWWLRVVAASFGRHAH